MAYVIRDTNPQYGGQCYFVGTRKIKDPRGRDCEAADFGDRKHAAMFKSRSSADERAKVLNKIANAKQFVVEEFSIYGQQYGKRKTNGFAGFGMLPQEEPQVHGGFKWEVENGYNGF